MNINKKVQVKNLESPFTESLALWLCPLELWHTLLLSKKNNL